MIPVLANAGTPLLWLTMTHLSVGNVAIGVFEAVVLALVLRVPMNRGIPWMIGANFASMLLGLPLIAGAGAMHPDSLLPSGAVLWLVSMAAVLFAVTVLVEWPFVARAMGRRDRRARSALFGSFLVQTASYAVLVPLYLNVSRLDVLTETTCVGTATIASCKAQIYYLAPDGRSIWRVALDGSDPQRVAEIADGGSRTRLVADPASGAVKAEGTGTAAVPAFGTVAPRASSAIGPAADLAGGPWNVRTGFWAVEGLKAENRKTGEHLHFALETPFLAWPSRDATVLPGDVVVYALGPHVVALDLTTKRLAVLAEGYSPVVVMDPR